MKNKITVGCAGFTQGYWRGFFFPEDLPSKEHLSFYAERLSGVEINSTFYRRPMLKTLEKWYNSTPSDFQFFVKIPKTVTHIKKLQETRDETTAFCQHISSGLQEKLAGFLFQLPPSYKFNSENLDKVLQTVDKDFLNVVEFRDKSWWTDEVFNTLRENDVVFPGVSFPKDIPDSLIINSEEVLYYRLHGVPVLFKSEYSNEELNSLAKKINNFKGKSFVFFNNTWGIAGIKNALELHEILGKL